MDVKRYNIVVSEAELVEGMEAVIEVKGRSKSDVATSAAALCFTNRFVCSAPRSNGRVGIGWENTELVNSLNC
jgi:hypothetical protein